MRRSRLVLWKKRRCAIKRLHRSLIEDDLANAAFFLIPHDHVREQTGLEPERYCFRATNLNSCPLNWDRASEVEVTHRPGIESQRCLLRNDFLLDYRPNFHRRQRRSNHSTVREDVVI